MQVKLVLQPGKPSNILVLSIWFGLLFGFGEVLYQLLLKFMLNKAIWQSQHFVWMVPLMLTIMLALLGLILLLPALKWRALANPGIASAIFTFPGLMAIYFVKPRIHIIAALFLATGIAVQVGRMVYKRPGNFMKLVSLTLPWMTGSLILLMIVMLGYYQ